MDIDASGYNGIISNSSSDLEVELSTGGTNSTTYNAKLIAIKGTNYTYQVNGLESGTTYKLISISYNNNQYFELMNNIHISTVDELNL